MSLCSTCRSISGGSSTLCWEPTTMKLLLSSPLLLGRAETGTHRVPGAQSEAQLCVWMGEAGAEPAEGSHGVPALQTHFEGDFFLCLSQSPGQPLKTAPSQQMHSQLSPAIRSGQAKAHPKCGAWVFGGAMWEPALAFGNQPRGEEQGDFYFSKDTDKRTPQWSSDLPFCTVREGHEDVPSNSCSIPRLFGWGDGHQLQHL